LRQTQFSVPIDRHIKPAALQQSRNIANERYRLAIAGLDAILDLRFMERAPNSPAISRALASSGRRR